jgi:putative membrane protein
LGQLAQKKTNSAEVKELGRRLEEEYHDSYMKLLALAKQKLVTLPTITTTKAQTAYDKLNEKSDTQFDKAYCNMMVSEQKEAIALFENASANVKDQDIKIWALATLPLLKIHLDRAIQCQKNHEPN